MTIDRRWGFWIATFVGFLLFLYVFSPILLPFLVGMMIAYLLDPVADWFVRKGFGRLTATTIILILFLIVFIALLILVVPVLINEIVNFVNDVPDYVKRFEALIEADDEQQLGAESRGQRRRRPLVARRASRPGRDLVHEHCRIPGEREPLADQPDLAPGGDPGGRVLPALRLGPDGRDRRQLDPARQRRRGPRPARQIDRVIAAFVRGQSLVGLTLGVFYASGLVMLGVNFGFLIGLCAGVISFIPYVGSTLGFIVSVGIALVQFWPDWIWIVATAALFVVGQLLEGYVLQPYFIGNNVGLHPVWLMFALFAFGLLFGFVGLLVAIPAAAAIGVLVALCLDAVPGEPDLSRQQPDRQERQMTPRPPPAQQLPLGLEHKPAMSRADFLSGAGQRGGGGADRPLAGMARARACS